MKRARFIGGAIIGSYHINMPFANFYAYPDKIIFNAGMGGRLEFSKDDILEIRTESRGIEILHELNYYEKPIIFLPLRSKGYVIKQLIKLGLYEPKEK